MTSISAIIPTFSRPAMLRVAVQSIQAQTLAPHEIVVVDSDCGASARETVTAMQEKDPRVRYLASAGGASASRNEGARASRGEILAFLDDDDDWRPEYLARACERLERSSADAVITWLSTDEGGVIGPWKLMRPGLGIDAFFADNPGVTGSNIVVRREAFDAIGGFDERLLVSEDKDFLMRLIEKGKRYAVVEEHLATKRVHAAGHLSSAADPRFLEGLRRFFAKYEARMPAGTRRSLHGRILYSACQAEPRRVDRLRALVSLVASGQTRYLVSLVVSALRRGPRTVP